MTIVYDKLRLSPAYQNFHQGLSGSSGLPVSPELDVSVGGVGGGAVGGAVGGAGSVVEGDAAASDRAACDAAGGGESGCPQRLRDLVC